MRKSIIGSTAMASRFAAMKTGDECMVWEIVKGNPNTVYWNPIQVGKHIGWCDDHGRPVKQPYAIGSPIYVRETWCNPFAEHQKAWYKASDPNPDEFKRMGWKWKSATNMPKEAARTWLTPSEVVCVRVHSLSVDNLLALGLIHFKSFEQQVISKHGQAAWDNNSFIWLTKMIKTENI